MGSTTRVYVIEGVAGSGKDTLARQLVAALQPDVRPVLVWDETAVLASWHHYYLPGIDTLRLDLTESLAGHMEATLAQQPDTVFVFNRLHVSHAVWRAEKHAATPELEARHDRVVQRLAALGTLVLHPVLDISSLEERTSHNERQEAAWRAFLQRRAADMGSPSPGQMYGDQQAAMQRVLARDGLPWRALNVAPGQPVDLGGVV